MLIGYAQVSTQEQDTQAQISALKSAGCELIFQEKASGGRWDRPKLQRLLQQLREKEIVSLIMSGQKTTADTARLFQVHPSTVGRLLVKQRVDGHQINLHKGE